MDKMPDPPPRGKRPSDIALRLAHPGEYPQRAINVDKMKSILNKTLSCAAVADKYLGFDKPKSKSPSSCTNNSDSDLDDSASEEAKISRKSEN